MTPVSRVVPRVLVVDDDRVFAEALAHRLRRVAAIGDAQVACTVEQALDAAGRRAPDLVLLDPDLEGGSGLGLIRHLGVLSRRPRVVVLADGPEPPARSPGPVPDDCRWMSKESSFEDLLEAMTEPAGGARGDLSVPAGQEWAVVSQLPSGHRAAPVGTDLETVLTDRQRDVLRCLLQGMTRAEVAASLHLSRHTVRDHVRHLFHKAGVASSPELAARARQAGLAEAPTLRVVRDP